MSARPKMNAAGSVTVRPDGVVEVVGFDFENCSCREAVRLGMAWAIEKIGASLVENMTADSPDLSVID